MALPPHKVVLCCLQQSPYIASGVVATFVPGRNQTLDAVQLCVIKLIGPLIGSHSKPQCSDFRLVRVEMR